MNRTLTATILSALAVGISVFSLIGIRTYYSRTVSRLDAVLESAVNNDKEKVAEYANIANEKWETEKNLMNVLVGMSGTSDITRDMRKIVRFAQIGDMASVILYTQECKANFEIIKDSAEPNLSTIL